VKPFPHDGGALGVGFAGRWAAQMLKESTDLSISPPGLVVVRRLGLVLNLSLLSPS
jgi:hypothetical protein